MKTTVIPHGLIGLVLSLLSAGCGTLQFSSQPERKDSPPSAEQQQTILTAKALAEYSLGVMEHDAGHTDEAFRRYQEAIKLDPDNAGLKMELAIAYLHAQRYEEMDSLLDQIISEYPRMVRAYQLKALGYRVRKMDQEAIEPLSMAIKIEPEESLHYLEMASIQARMGDLDQAIQILEHSLDDVTDRLSIFQALGELYLRQATELASRKKARLPKSPLELLGLGVQEFPNDPYLLEQYGDLLVLHKRMEEAITVFTKIEELNPDNLQLRQKLAMSLISVGDRESAIELLEGIAEKRPDNYRLWYYLAELHQQGTNRSRAVECYQKAIEIKPDLAESYLRLSYLQLSSEEPDQAKQTLETGLKNKPDDLRLVEMLAYVYLLQNDFTNAVSFFSRAEEHYGREQSSPLLSNFYLNYAIANQLAGETDEAIRLIRKGSKDNPDFINDYLATAFRNRDNTERLKSTLALLEPLQDLIPNESATYTLYGLIAFNAEEYAAALSLFERAESLAVEEETDEELTAQFYFWLGACAERIKDFDRSEQYFLNAIARQPDHADSHNYLAYMQAERGVKLDMALDHAGVALAVEPDNPAYLDTRGWIYFRQGEYELALADISLAFESLPDDPTISDHLGDIYAAMGNMEKAVELWKTSFSLDPANDDVKKKLDSVSDKSMVNEASPN